MADIRIDFEGNASDLIRELGKVRDAVDRVEGAADDAGDEFADLGTGAVGAGGGIDTLKRGAIALGGVLAASKVKDFVVDSTNLAVAAEEAGNKFDAVFGPAASGLAGDLDELGDKAGITDFRLKDIVATAGNVIQGLGGTRQEAAEMAAALAPLAIDVASFNGSISDAPEALQSMTSALTGNRESLKDRWGIVVREAEVIQRALEMSFKDSASELTELEKAQATYSLIVERSANAVGDLDRNLDSAATRQARATAEYEEARVELGERLLPVVTSLSEMAAEAATSLVGMLDPMRATLSDPAIEEAPGFFERAATALGVLGRAFTSEMDVNQVEGLRQALQHYAGALLDGVAPSDALAASMAELARNNILTEPTVEALAGAVGASTEEVELAAAVAANYYRDMGGHGQQVMELEEFTSALAIIVAMYGDNMADSADDLSTFEARMRGVISATRDGTGATEEAIEAEKTLTEIRDTQVSALGKVKKAQDDVTEARDALLALEQNPGATEDQVADAAWRLVEAETTLALVMEKFAENQGPMYTDALVDIGREAGLAGDALWAFVTAALAAQNIGTPGSGANDITTISIGGPKPVPTQHGGIVRARPGGTFLQAGEAGSDEAVLPLNDQGIGVIADAFSQALGTGDIGGGGGPTFVINVQGFVGSEMQLAAEIDRILTRRKRSSGLELL